MITVTFHKNLEYWEIHHTVKGHAGLAELGKDIVCSAASILTQTLAQIVHDREHLLVGKPTIKLERGDADIYCKCAYENVFIDMIRALDFVVTGYKLLAVNFPQYVEIYESFDTE